MMRAATGMGSVFENSAANCVSKMLVHTVCAKRCEVRFNQYYRPCLKLLVPAVFHNFCEKLLPAWEG
jgi:hypothetical protein